MVKLVRKILFLSAFAIAYSCATTRIDDNSAVVGVLDSWHKAAAEANFDAYFSLMAADAVYIGTDPTENWQLDAFKAFSKPYFSRGKAWNFTPVERHVHFNDRRDFAWFDELLSTQMKLCRGSGVLRKENGQWKIVHYVLSIAIPNDYTEQVTKLKAAYDDALIKKLSANRP